jgi:hypothetical protein
MKTICPALTSSAEKKSGTSTPWKTFSTPWKTFSTLWKIFPDFSTPWKKVSMLWKKFSMPWKFRIFWALAWGAGFGAWGESAIERLAIWCEFMPYAEVQEHLPTLAAHGCDLILHVGRESFGDAEFGELLRAAERAGVGVDAWLLLPYEEHLYVGQASVAAVRDLAERAADYFEANGLAVRGFVFDCEPSPILGAELFAAAREKDLRGMAGILRGQLDPEGFARDAAALNEVIGDLRRRGYAVDGAANRAFLDAQARGNVALEDALNAPVSALEWDALSFITYRYGAGQTAYVGMLNRYATLARRLWGERAAIDVGLLGDYDGIAENAERAERFGGGEAFYAYLRGKRDPRDLEQAVGVVLGCGVRRINLYALDGAAHSVAGLDNWLKAARRAKPLSRLARWTPGRSLVYGGMGALTEKTFRWMTGGSEKTHGKLDIVPAPARAGERKS